MNTGPPRAGRKHGLSMTDNTVCNPGGDPIVPNWTDTELPDTWADRFDFRKPSHWLHFFRAIVGKERLRVSLPEQLPGRERIPKYVLQEFHGLPNGNYSKRITRGYINGFDRIMLGVMDGARDRIANALRHCQSVLDAGCAGGRTAAAVKEAGVSDVWGLDPSPYLLQHAAQDHPQVKFVQAVAEDTGFPDQRFDGLAVCFLLHEIPPRYLRKVLAEFDRILRPGGLLAVCEPSHVQVEKGWWALFRSHGPKGLYFRWLAHFAFEPFLNAWHRHGGPALFQSFGFECLSDDPGMPLRHMLFRKMA